MKNSYFFPVTLIVIGSLILLYQLELVEITRTRPYIFIIVFTLLGIVLIRKYIMYPNRKGLLGGSFFLLLALILLLMELNVLPIHDQFAFPAVLLSLGLSNLIYYIFTRKSISNIIFGIIFIALGLPFILIYYGPLSYWEVADMFSVYWPLLLITAGIGFLADGLIRIKKAA